MKLWHIHQSSKRRLKRLILKYGNVKTSYFGFQYLWKKKKKKRGLFCLIQHSVSAQWHAPSFLKIHFKAHIKIHLRVFKSCALSEVDNLLDFEHYSIIKHSDLKTHCKSLLIMLHLMVNSDGFRWLLMSTQEFF